MQVRKVTNIKNLAIGVLSAGVLIAGGYAVGEAGASQPVSALAPSSQAITASAIAKPTAPASDPNGAMIASAVEYSLQQKGVAAGTNKISQLQIENAWARGKLVNADSSGVFYAHEVQGDWTVVYTGQAALPQSVATQYGFPASWVGQMSWYN